MKACHLGKWELTNAFSMISSSALRACPAQVSPTALPSLHRWLCLTRELPADLTADIIIALHTCLGCQYLMCWHMCCQLWSDLQLLKPASSLMNILLHSCTTRTSCLSTSLGADVNSRQQLRLLIACLNWTPGSNYMALYTSLLRPPYLHDTGQYQMGSSSGKQVFSTKKSAPTINFGSSTRDSVKKMFISVDHEKSNYGECSPGPTTANPGKGIGAQQLSTNETAPRWGFGSGKRLSSYATDTPGPGEYYA